jgi:hypothetical protein
MTKEDTALKDIPLKDWTWEQCNQADTLIKVMATEQLAKVIESYKLPKIVQEYLIMMARYHYGSVETNDLLTALKCYPDWMFVSK